MKRTKVLFFSLVLVLFALFFSGVNFKAAEVATSDTISVKGAQVRTSDPLGIRFVGTAEGEYDAYGIAIAFGDVEVNQVVLGATINGKAVLSAEASEKDEDGQYYISLISIPENMYVQDVTARAYVKNGAEVTYATTAVVRNLAEVSFAVKNAGGEVVESVLTYVEANYMNYYQDLEGNYNINNLYEWNPTNLEKVFVKDWNAKFGTEWTEIVAADFFNSASTGFTSKSDSDARVSNIYKFFNDANYSSKWGWLLDYLLEFADVHPKRQINAIKSPEGYCKDGYGDGMNFTSHLCYSIANFFNNANQSGGYAPIDFTNVSKYNKILQHNNVIYISDANFAKIGSNISLPSALAPEAGYSWDGWYANDVKYEADSNYTVTVEAIKFVPQFVANYDMSVFYVDKNATEDTTSCNGSLVKLGINLFKTISEAVAAVESGKTVMVMPGSYSENVTLNKAVKLTTLNATNNPVVDLTSFTNANTKVVITGEFLITASNVKISGFTFTGAARVIGYGDSTTRNGLEFKNNYVYDTNEASIAFKNTRYGNGTTGAATFKSTYPGFISLAYSYGWVNNLKVMDNVFSNVSDVNVYVVCTNNATITGNKFVGCDRDVMRFDYNNNYGTFNIKNNSFEDVAYNAINIRSFGGSGTGEAVINVENNSFKNVATNATKVIGTTTLGCVSSSAHQEAFLVTMNIKYNSFENCGGYITPRVNCKVDQFFVNVLYNSFIDDNASTVAFSASVTSNQKGVTFDHNFYGTDANTKVVPTASQYDANHLISKDTTIYNSVAALEEAIAALK